MKICEAGRTPGCCSNPRLRTINTMGPDTDGNFTVRGTQGVHVTTGTNEIIISGIAMYYSNTDGNLEIDNDLLTIDLADNIVITGDLTVNGTFYTVHAEHVYTEDDYIFMRDGATTGLSPGQYSGFEVIKYDGTNNGRLVIDNSGVARVGDVNDEQPLLTREEAANLNNGALLKWDAANQKAVDEGTIGSDTKPIKIVNGVATPVTRDLGIVNSLLLDSDSVSIDSGVVEHPNEITIQETGVYLIVVQGGFQVYNAGKRLIGYSVNSTSAWNWLLNITANDDQTYMSGCRISGFNAGDVIRSAAYQTSGVTLSIGLNLYLVRLY